jgi:hypothetical protein
MAPLGVRQLAGRGCKSADIVPLLAQSDALQIWTWALLLQSVPEGEPHEHIVQPRMSVALP